MGFIGHDGKFYTQHELDQKVDAYVRRYGHPTPGDKVNFSELVGFNRNIQPTISYDLTRKENLDAATQEHGFENAEHLAASIRVSKYSPYEMLQHAAKGNAIPPEISAERGHNISVNTGDFVRDVVQTFTNRHPLISDKVHFVHIQDEPTARWLAKTAITSDGKIGMYINAAYLPNKPAGQEALTAFKFKPTQGKEFLSTTLEHELTHGVQYWLDQRGLGRAFGSPPMMVDREVHEPMIEGQAENRARCTSAVFSRPRESTTTVLHRCQKMCEWLR